MKIADPIMIKAGEQELIRTIMEKLDPSVIEAMAAENLSVDSMEFRSGDMVIHDNRIVYQMDFNVTISVSVLFDREGSIIQSLDAGTEIEAMEPSESLHPDDGPDDIPVEEAGGGDGIDTSPEAESGQEAPSEREAPGGDEDTMADVLLRTRQFWLRQSSDAEQETAAGTTMEEPSTAMEGLGQVLKKNREFWTSQTA